MFRLTSALAKGALITTVAVGALAASTTVAFADVACNRAGECWHVKEHYTNYPANLGVTFHDDAWRAKHTGQKWLWREDRPDDHGYYDKGVWHPF
jgi:hypothetical protein